MIKVADKIAELIIKMENSLTSSIIHMDISNNQFDEEEFDIISKELYNNHTIYGFHYEGNFGHTDEKMFLVGPELPECDDKISDDDDEEEQDVPIVSREDLDIIEKFERE